ncbi:MAG: hypothetical protein L3J81_06035, partial [Thermoplasmata archaeon]|nr:hypothetical protein [Thermoplasmata archaeon]
MALHVDDVVVVVHHRTHRRDLVGEHGRLEELLVGGPVRVLLAPTGRGERLLVPIAPVEDGRDLAGRRVVPVRHVGVLLDHRTRHLVDGVAGGLGADYAHPTRSVAGWLGLESGGHLTHITLFSGSVPVVGHVFAPSNLQELALFLRQQLIDGAHLLVGDLFQILFYPFQLV